MEKENSRQPYNKKVQIIWACAFVIIIFVFIFSMFHLQQRGEDRLDRSIVNYNYVPSVIGEFQETNDVVNSSEEEVAQMIPTLSMQYEDAKVNNEPYEAQTAGMRLALAYIKIHDRKDAKALLNSLIATYPYDTEFVARCNRILEDID